MASTGNPLAGLFSFFDSLFSGGGGGGFGGGAPTGGTYSPQTDPFNQFFSVMPAQSAARYGSAAVKTGPQVIDPWDPTSDEFWAKIRATNLPAGGELNTYTPKPTQTPTSIPPPSRLGAPAPTPTAEWEEPVAPAAMPLPDEFAPPSPARPNMPGPVDPGMSLDTSSAPTPGPVDPGMDLGLPDPAARAVARAPATPEFAAIAHLRQTPRPEPVKTAPLTIKQELRQSQGPRLLSMTEAAGHTGKGFPLADVFKDPNVNPVVRDRFAALQEAAGEQLNINSVYRSVEHNRRVGGARNSQHTRGNAVDINVRDWPTEKRVALIEKASALGFKGIGVYDNAIHVDVGNRRSWGPSYSSRDIPKWARATVNKHLQGAYLKPQAPPPQASRVVNPSDYFGEGINVAQLPAGMRNNNPGNLKFSGSAYQRANYPGMMGPSVNKDQGSPQIVFASPEDGMTATAQLVFNKFRDDGYDTVKKMVNGPKGWTPYSTAPDAVPNIAKQMGVKPDAKLDFNDPVTMQTFLRALITQEHGPSAKLYSDDLIAHGIARIKRG
jgi:hypothetical protein